jgi:hypothetical protein
VVAPGPSDAQQLTHARAAQTLGYRPPVYDEADLIPLDSITSAAEAAPTPIEDESSARQRRTYIRTIADAPTAAPSALGRIAIRKLPTGAVPAILPPRADATEVYATLGEATRAIRRGTGRDRVADLVIDSLDRFTPGCDAAILLVIRGATAIGWKGFLRTGGGLNEIALPMEHGLVPQVVERNCTLRKAYDDLDPIDRLLLASLGRQTGDLVVVPIAIVDQVMCVIALAADDAAPVASAEPIAAAAGAAFARLMRDASR